MAPKVPPSLLLVTLSVVVSNGGDGLGTLALLVRKPKKLNQRQRQRRDSILRNVPHNAAGRKSRGPLQAGEGLPERSVARLAMSVSLAGFKSEWPQSMKRQVGCMCDCCD